VIECNVAGEALLLLAERAMYWPDRRVLFIADFHLGKAASFRKLGIPLPQGTTQENVSRLDRAIERTGATEVVFLGDFLHSAAGRAEKTLATFGEWRASRRKVALTIVRGNHDKNAGDPPAEWGARCIDAGERLGTFVLNHEPGPSKGGYALAGHIHPAVRLSAEGERGVKLPCFWFGARCGVLPAFGAFTGSVSVLPKRGDQVFVIAESEVLQVG